MRTFLGLMSKEAKFSSTQAKSSSTHAHVHVVTASAHYCSVRPYPQHSRLKQQQRHTHSSSLSCLTTMSSPIEVDYSVEEEVLEQAPSAEKQTLYPATTTKAKAAAKLGKLDCALDS
eukprot:6491514-Amphidinium_carterae.2